MANTILIDYIVTVQTMVSYGILWYPMVTIFACNQPFRSTQPGHPSVGRCNVNQPKLRQKYYRHITSPIFIIEQC